MLGNQLNIVGYLKFRPPSLNVLGIHAVLVARNG